MSKKEKYIAWLLVKKESTYSVIAKRRINPIKKLFSFKGNAYMLNIANYTFSKGLKLFYLIDIQEAKLSLKKFEKEHENSKKPKEKPTIMAEILKKDDISNDLKAKIMLNNVIGQIVSGLTDKAIKINIWLVIFVAIFGGVLGYMIRGYVGG